MNGNSLASTPKGSSQHQNQSSSTQGFQTHNLWTQEKRNTTISQSRGSITYWIKIAAKIKLAFLLALSDSADIVTGKGIFLAAHGRQCLRLSLCWLVITSSSCASNTVTRTAEALNLRPAWDFFQASIPEEGDTSFSLLFLLPPAQWCMQNVSQLPQEKAQQCLQGRRMQSCPVRRKFVSRLAPADWSPVPPAGTVSEQRRCRTSCIPSHLHMVPLPLATT